MNGLRFKVGELAIFMVAIEKTGVPYQGSLVEVVQIGPYKRGEILTGVILTSDTDYLLRAGDGALGIAYDYQLRKIDPPAEPEAMTRHEEIEVPA